MWRLTTSEGGGPWLRSANNFLGRQVWEYNPDAGTPEERAEVDMLRENFTKHRFQRKESQDLLLRLQIFSFYVTCSLNMVLSPEHRREILRYIYNHQNKDGGWGKQVLGPSTMFGSCFSYASLVLLGENLDFHNDALAKGCAWILSHGSATAIPQWGKIWLSIIGVYEWSGNNPIIPELWLVPDFLPIHPGRFWCFTRLVYMSMAYLYGKKFVGPITPAILALREDLYDTPYEIINWDKARDSCAKEDLHYPHSRVQTIVFGCLNKFVEPILNCWPVNKLRDRALRNLIEHIHYEDETTNYVGKCPINKVYDGCHNWEIAFIVQAYCSTDLIGEFVPTLEKAHEFMKKSQVLKNQPNYEIYYRHRSKGAWKLSTIDNGWSVADCTAEVIKTLLWLSKISPNIVGDPITQERLYDAIDCLLSFMNKDGTFSTYECKRTASWLEVLNPSETFRNIVVDYPSVECTSSALDALIIFKDMYPQYRRREIEKCVQNSTTFIEKSQQRDGAWYGTWGVCFTYGTMFAVRGLVAAGRTYDNSYSIREACNFILSKQQTNGGWGESYISSDIEDYVDSDNPIAVNTSFAMLALIYAGQLERDPTPIYNEARQLINMQLKTGEFPQQEHIGCFNSSLYFNYPNYRNLFPIMALGELQSRLPENKN